MRAEGDGGCAVALDERDEAWRLLAEGLVGGPEGLAEEGAELGGDGGMPDVGGETVEKRVWSDDVVVSNALDAFNCVEKSDHGHTHTLACVVDEMGHTGE